MKALLPRLLLGIALAVSTLDAEEDSPKPFKLEQAAAMVGKDCVDPKQADLVAFGIDARGVWESTERLTILGWRKDGVLKFGDGAKVPDGWAHDVKPATFPDAIAALYQEKGPDAKDDTFGRMEVTALGCGENHLANAAWLESAGKHDEAARALAAANAGIRGSQSALDVWLAERAWFYYAGMVHSFMRGLDAEAEAYGKLLLERFPELHEKIYPEAARVLADIRRRKDHPLPAVKVDDLPENERVPRLIAEMEDIRELQSGQPGGVDLAEAPCVKALITIGDPAVLPLLDVLEHDARLTRSVHFWRDFAPYRTVLSVKEAALTAIMSILRTRFFDAASTGDNFTARDDQQQAAMIRGIRNYWEKYGKLPFDERMMAILTAKETSAEARREAAGNLATLNDQVAYGTTVWTGSYRKSELPNPVIAKFSNPTVAEATLASHDRELEEIRRKEAEWREAGKKVVQPGEESEFVIGEKRFDPMREMEESVDSCVETLGLLGDGRVAGSLAERSKKATKLRIRARWAQVADQLGDSSAVLSLKDALVADDLKPPSKSDGAAFRVVFHCLASSRNPDAIFGLKAILNPKHRWRTLAVNDLLYGSSDHFDSEPSPLGNPWCLELLKTLLDEMTPVGRSMSIAFDKEENQWRYTIQKRDGDESGVAEPRILDESKYARNAKVRRCDQAAMRLLEALGDREEDEFFPLAKDRDRRIEDLKQFLKTYQGTFRDFGEFMDGGTGSDQSFLPVLRPLDHAATDDDVRAGKARFALEHPGKPPGLRPPFATEWLGRKPHGQLISSAPDAIYSRSVVVLQVERDDKGELWFGVSDGNGFHVVPSKEIGALEALGEAEP